MTDGWDVVVVGGGNAGFSAAQAARQAGSTVLLLEKSKAELAGGNTYYTAGAFRLAHGGVEELAPLLTASDRARVDNGEVVLGAYGAELFTADLDRVTRGRSAPELAEVLVHESQPAIQWLAELGVEFTLLYERQSYEVDGARRFWGGLSVGAVDEGPGLMRRHTESARAAGIEVRYEAPVLGLIGTGDGRTTGVVYGSLDGHHAVRARSVVMCAGGFQADPRLRAAYLGAGWEHAKVRGTPSNTGEVMMKALADGAQATGHWSGCHAVAWDSGAPDTGDRAMTNLHTKQSYPLGIVVNAEGRRFIDEGADFRNYTYAKYGAEILRQPGSLAFQLFDGKTRPLLRTGEYTSAANTRIEAESLDDLARIAGIPERALKNTVAEFNSAIGPETFDPSIRDGKAAAGCMPPKSNWALPLDTPPFLAFPVTCGITFTFGGVRIDAYGRVIDQSGRAMPGLYAAGEMIGGLFHHNYPGGSGLTAGTVFGRRAGLAAAED